MHNGRIPYPNVLDSMQRLRSGGMNIVLLSNSPRRKQAVVEQLQKIGVPTDTYDDLVTSGELVFAALQRQTKSQGARSYFPIAPAGIDYLTEELSDRREDNLNCADYVLLIGPINDAVDRVEDYHRVLATAAARSLPMVCANPEHYVMRGQQQVLGAGAIAAAVSKDLPEDLLLSIASQTAALTVSRLGPQGLNLN